jgi:hypothetical protein
MLLRVILLAGLVAVLVPLQAASPPERSRGVAADGRVVTSQYGVPPPWGRDVTHFEKPHYPESLRAEHPVVIGFFRLILDLHTGHVLRVITERSSGYLVGDANIVAGPSGSGGSNRIHGRNSRFM